MNGISQIAAREDGSLRRRFFRWARRRSQGRLLHVLTYHSIAPADNPFILGQGQRHAPEELAAQLAYLRRHYRPMRLTDAVAALEQRRPLHRAAVVTFDDGFRDAIDFALPLLREYNIPATVFVVTSVVGNTDLMWRHKLTWLLSHGLAAQVYDALRSEYRRAGLELYHEQLLHDTAAIPDLHALTRQRFLPQIIPPLLDELMRRHGWNPAHLAAHHRPYLEPRDLRQADPAWLEFGNHTHTHPMLSALSPAEQAAELSTAGEHLTRWTGRRPIAVAYPFGLHDSYNAAAVEAVARSGHHAALDMRRRINTAATSPLDISRRPAPRGGAEQLAAAMEDWRFTPVRSSAREAGDALLLTRRMFRGAPRPVRTMLRGAWPPAATETTSQPTDTAELQHTSTGEPA